ncbi:MAG TPA: VOC family protein [Thermoanaerobaculia bacterium]|nr:VOC family protein [Thermoanaerobaculia bacterium]
MLERTDRIGLVVPDADAAAETYRQIFDSRIVGDEMDRATGARRVTLQWGRDQVELHQPHGEGAAAEFLTRGRRGLFLGGFALADPGACAARLERAGVRVHEERGDRYVVLPEDLDGTGVVLSRRVERERVGLVDKIWQITYAVPDLRAAVERYSRLFGVEDDFTNWYHSDHFGYDGAITWFEARDGGLLDSLEYLEPTDEGVAVDRFVRRGGSGIYMCSIETDDIPEIRRRVEAGGPGWDGDRAAAFIHPRRLHGLLVGLVRFDDWNARRPLPGGAAT